MFEGSADDGTPPHVCNGNFENPVDTTRYLKYIIIYIHLNI